MNELKKSPQWVCWTRDPERGKIPKNPKTGGNAQSDNRATWTTYQQAEAVAGDYDGVGFMFDNGISGIDIDGVNGDVERERQAKDIIAHMNTYTEYSPSGSGYHIIFRVDISKLPKDYKALYYQKNVQTGVECYISGMTNRFFTYTGEAINDLDIEDRTDQLLSFLDKYMKRKNPPERATATEDSGIKKVPTNNIDVLSIIDKARKGKNGNGEKFSLLFDQGNISAYGNDESSADQALCNILAFWCGNNPDVIDSMFRQSALMRPKWEREDYRTATINKGIEICGGEFYRSPGRPKTKQPEPMGDQGGVSLIPDDFTHMGEADILAREYKKYLRYSEQTGFITYNGKKWEEIRARSKSAMQKLTSRQLKEARVMLKAAQSTEEKEFAEAYDKFVKKCRSDGGSAGVLSQAQPKVLVSVNDLDVNPFLLNTPAGTIDLTTGNMKPHDPDDLCTKITKVSPNSEGMEIFKECLRVTTCGDKELEDYIQLSMGMAAIGKVFSENLLIPYGEGNNGKSTLINACARVLGDYYGTIDPKTLLANEKGSKNYDYAELRGQRLIIAAELEEGSRLSTSAMKRLCSTDEVHAEKKYKDPFKFTPSHTVVLYTNFLPKVGASDRGTWRRLIVIPFDAKIEPNKDIKNYADYLVKHAGGAILSWIIEGAKRFIEAGYTIQHPQRVKDAIAQYRSDNDWLGAFLYDCCEIGQGLSQPAGELLTRYRKYCIDTGEYARGQADFKKALESAGYEYRKTMKGTFYYGLRLKPLQPTNEELPPEWR